MFRDGSMAARLAAESTAGTTITEGAEVSGPETTASSKGSRGSLTDVILPADRREAAALAAIHIVGLGRKIAGGDRVESVREPLLRVGEHLCPVDRRRKERDDTARPLEGDVR